MDEMIRAISEKVQCILEISLVMWPAWNKGFGCAQIAQGKYTEHTTKL